LHAFLRYLGAALPGLAGVIAEGDPVDEVTLRVLGVERDHETARVGALAQLDADARTRGARHRVRRLEVAADVDGFRPGRAFVVGGHELEAVALGVLRADGESAELLAAGGEGLEKEEDPAALGVLHEARVVAAVGPLLVGDGRFGPLLSLILGCGDHQVVAGLVGGLVAGLGHGDQGALGRA